MCMDYKPVNFTKRSDEQLDYDAKYALDILNSCQGGLDRVKLSPQGLSIVELGPGSDFAAELLLASKGARVTVADRFLAPFDPDYHPKLYAEVGKRYDGPKGELEAAIGGGYEATSLTLFPEPAENLRSIPDASTDFVYSNAVLEHIADINAVTCELARITKPGGFGMHQIDLRDHRDFARPLEHLTIQEAEFQRAAPEIAFEFGNRLRLSEFRAHFEAAGFTVVEEQISASADPPYLQEALPRIRGADNRYRFWPEDDLRCVSVCLYVRRETGVSESAIQSRGKEFLSLIASLSASAQEQYQALARYHRITEAEKRISELTADADLREQKIALLSQILVERERTIERRERTIERLEQSLKDVFASTSWRLTAPLRWVRSMFLR